MVARLSSRFGKRMMRLRSATVELVLGSLINYYGLRQINTRSREAAAKVMYVAAIAYNLKKYLRFTPIEQSGMVIALLVPDLFYYILIHFCNSPILYTTIPLKCNVHLTSNPAFRMVLFSDTESYQDRCRIGLWKYLLHRVMSDQTLTKQRFPGTAKISGNFTT
jgi:hypothetical protein